MLALLHLISEVPVANLGPQTGYPVFVYVFHSPSRQILGQNIEFDNHLIQFINHPIISSNSYSTTDSVVKYTTNTTPYSIHLGGNSGRCVRLTLPPSRADCLEILEA